MTDRPIIFSAPMVRALLEGRKRETRRLAWRFPKHDTDLGESIGVKPTIWQKASAGDRCYVKETHWRLGRWVKDGLTETGRQRWRFRAKGKSVLYDTPAEEFRGRIRGAEQPAKYWKRPSIFMPIWASRLTLVITEARRERLQEIDGISALAEGITPQEGVAPWRVFMRLWNSVHGDGAWEANPEVVAIRFEVHRANIDSMERAA